MSEDTKKCPYCREEIIADAIKCKHCGSMLQTPPTDPLGTFDLPPIGSLLATDGKLSRRYTIVKELGRGGMGVVYLAHDDELDMDVAIKLLPVELSNDRRALEQLHSEAKLSMSLSHDNIMRLHTLDTSGQFKFLVMEYVDGPSLLDILREKERLPLDEALPIVKAICDGVEYAHSKRVLHRDLKPANIMLSSKGQVKITDFGIARRMRESMSMISQKTISGTPAYMAPEHIMGEHLTVRSDIYSLGAVTYELLAGHPPFHQGDISTQIRFKAPEPIPGIPEPVNAAILKALAKNADERPESATVFYKSLTTAPDRLAALPATRVQKPRVSHPPKPTPPPPRKKKRSTLLIASILILCLAVATAVTTAILWVPGSTTPEGAGASPSIDEARKEAEAEKQAREEAERKIREAQVAAEDARKKAEAEKRAREEAKRKRREAEAAAELVRKQAEVERKAREEKERKRREAEAAAELARKQAEVERKAREEKERKQRESQEARFVELIKTAQKAVAEKRYQDSITLYQMALAIKDTKETRDLLQRAQSLLAQEEEKARKDKEKQEQAKKFLADAIRALESNDRKKAQKLAQSALNLDPGNEAAKALRKKSMEPPATFTNSISMKFVLIPAGEFMMGSLANEKSRDADEKQHRVKITKPFYMQTTEVTQAQWKAVMGNNPSRFKGDTLPVEEVSWDDVQEFLKKFSAKEGVQYRLPTEAEWEYACRAGSAGRFCFGDDESRLGEYAWYDNNSDSKTHPVGQKKPNAWGLYDMHGNVWEWCSDWYGEDYYGKSPANDPQGPASGGQRVLHGGSWGNYARYCRSANRLGSRPTFRYDNFGFRVSRSSQ